MTDTITLNKVLLSPLIRELQKSEFDHLLEQIPGISEQSLLDLLIYNGISILWLEYIVKNGHTHRFSQLFIERLNDQKKVSIATLNLQMEIMRQIHDIFVSNNIEYLYFKGSNLRYTIYDNPTYRPASDVDLLIREDDINRAASKLAEAGFDLRLDHKNISHELIAVKKTVALDLHWHIFRPGRTKYSLNDYLFSNRMMFEDLNGLNSEASLVVMLVHPAFTKYIMSPASLLIHLVDQHKLLSKEDINQESLVRNLDHFGCKTAAWASLYLLDILSGNSAIATISDNLSPGRLRKKYIAYWIENDLVNKYWSKKIIIQGLFNLVLQDSLSDSIIAVINLIGEKMKAEQKTGEIKKAIEY